MDNKKFKEILSNIVNNNTISQLDLKEFIMYAINVTGKQFDEGKLFMLIHHPAYNNIMIKMVLDYIYMYNDKFGIQPTVIQDKKGVVIRTIIADIDQN